MSVNKVFCVHRFGYVKAVISLIVRKVLCFVYVGKILLS